MNPEEFASEIIDSCADSDIVENYNLEIKENIVVTSRLELNKGIIDVYRNFKTGKVAFAWVLNNERVFGADNTGGWHLHPYENPEKHIESNKVSFPEFLHEVERILAEEE